MVSKEIVAEITKYLAQSARSKGKFGSFLEKASGGLTKSPWAEKSIKHLEKQARKK